MRNVGVSDAGQNDIICLTLAAACQSRLSRPGGARAAPTVFAGEAIVRCTGGVVEMRKWVLILGIIFLVLATVVLVFASGGRRWYSGLFFAIMGLVALANASRFEKSAEK